MASFDGSKQKGWFYVRFRSGGREFKKSLKLDTAKEAQRMCSSIETTIADIERGRLEMPPGAEVAAFLISGGKVSGPVRNPEKVVTVGSMLEEYEEKLTEGSKELNTRTMEAIHGRHLRRILDAEFPAARVSVAVIQKYVDSRAGGGRHLRLHDQERTQDVPVRRELVPRSRHRPGPAFLGHEGDDVPQGFREVPVPDPGPDRPPSRIRPARYGSPGRTLGIPLALPGADGRVHQLGSGPRQAPLDPGDARVRRLHGRAAAKCSNPR